MYYTDSQRAAICYLSQSFRREIIYGNQSKSSSRAVYNFTGRKLLRLHLLVAGRRQVLKALSKKSLSSRRIAISTDSTRPVLNMYFNNRLYYYSHVDRQLYVVRFVLGSVATCMVVRFAVFIWQPWCQRRPPAIFNFRSSHIQSGAKQPVCDLTFVFHIRSPERVLPNIILIPEMMLNRSMSTIYCKRNKNCITYVFFRNCTDRKRKLND